jgi:hypothetical protein
MMVMRSVGYSRRRARIGPQPSLNEGRHRAALSVRSLCAGRDHRASASVQLAAIAPADLANHHRAPTTGQREV